MILQCLTCKQACTFTKHNIVHGHYYPCLNRLQPYFLRTASHGFHTSSVLLMALRMQTFPRFLPLLHMPSRFCFLILFSVKKKQKTNTQQNSERDFHKGWGLYTKESLAWAQLWLWVWMFACQCEDGRCVQVVMPCLRILAKDKMKKGSIGEWVWWRIEDVCKLIMPLNVPASQ